ncbi:MAG: MFS transporter [Vicinamibacterales bacterium]
MTAAATEREARYAGWRVALASAVGLFCWSIPPMSFAVFLKPMAEDFAWSRQSVSAVFGVSALVAALGSAAAGYLVDRFGARVVVVPGLVLAGVAFALRAAIAPPFWHVVALFAVSGMAGVAASPVAYTRVITGWFDRRRGQALGIAVSGAALGAMVHPPVAQALIDMAGWRTAHVVLGAFILCVGVPVVAAMVRPHPAWSAAAQRTTTGATVREGLRSWKFWVLAVVLLCDGIANSSLSVHLVALLTDRGVPAAQAALALATMGAAAFAGRLASGWLLDRWFAPRISVSLLVASAGGMFLLADAHSMAVGAFAAALVGFGMGGEADVTPYLVSRYFGLRSFATLYGVMFMGTAFAWATGPALMGRAFDASGSYGPHAMRLGALLLAAAALMLTLPRYAAASPPDVTAGTAVAG